MLLLRSSSSSLQSFCYSLLIICFAKDTVICERLRADRQLKDVTVTHLEDFANIGWHHIVLIHYLCWRHSVNNVIVLCSLVLAVDFQLMDLVNVLKQCLWYIVLLYNCTCPWRIKPANLLPSVPKHSRQLCQFQHYLQTFEDACIRFHQMPTMSNTIFNWSLANDASVTGTLVQPPGTLYLTASSSLLTLTDYNSFSSLIYFMSLFDILLALLDNL